MARYGARLPAGTLPWPGGARARCCSPALTVALLVAVRRPVVRRLVAVVAVAVLLGTLPVRLVASGWPPAGGWSWPARWARATPLVLPVGAGRAVVVDAGPTRRRRTAACAGSAYGEVPLLVFSHFHADHIGGVAGVFRGRRVDRRASRRRGRSRPPGGTLVRRAAAAAGAG